MANFKLLNGFLIHGILNEIYSIYPTYPKFIDKSIIPLKRFRAEYQRNAFEGTLDNQFPFQFLFIFSAIFRLDLLFLDLNAV